MRSVDSLPKKMTRTPNERNMRSNSLNSTFQSKKQTKQSELNMMDNSAQNMLETIKHELMTFIKNELQGVEKLGALDTKIDNFERSILSIKAQQEEQAAQLNNLRQEVTTIKNVWLRKLSMKSSSGSDEGETS